jgi:hypothetical protein
MRQNASTTSAFGGNPDGICSSRAFSLMTRSGHVDSRLLSTTPVSSQPYRSRPRSSAGSRSSRTPQYPAAAKLAVARPIDRPYSARRGRFQLLPMGGICRLMDDPTNLRSLRRGFLPLRPRPKASGMEFAFRELVHTARAVVPLRLMRRIKSRLRRMFEAQIALTIGLIAGLILGWLTAGMQ